MPRYEARPCDVGENPWLQASEVSLPVAPRLGGQYATADSFLRNNVRRNYDRVGARKGRAYRLYVHLTNEQAAILGCDPGKHFYGVWYAPDATKFPTPEGFKR